MKIDIKFLSILVLLFSFSLFFSEQVFAATTPISIESREFKAGDVVYINGSGFGVPSFTYSYICFNNNEQCFSYSSNNVLRWTDNYISFIFPSDLQETTGSVLISNGVQEQICSGSYYTYCYNTTKPRQIASYPYVLVPVISHVTEIDGDVTKFALPGETIIIHGSSFRSMQGTLSFGDESGKILSWSDKQIVVTVPKTDKKTTEFFLLQRNGSGTRYPFAVQPAVSDDPLSSMQEYIINANVSSLWSLLKPKRTVTVAVIDDGVYYNHSDLQGILWQNSGEILGNAKDDDANGYVDDKYGWNFYYNTNDVTENNGHGTSVAGIIGAKKDNNVGIAGIARKVKIMPLIACGKKGCDTQAIIDAMNYAIDNGAKIINLSLGNPYTAKYTDKFDEVIKKANERNVFVVVASGNGDVTKGKGVDTSIFPLSPVCNEETRDQIIGVGASTLNNKYRTDFSNYGDCVDIYAQGESTLTTSLGDSEYDFQDGTSFSAPIITGVIAEIMSAYPTMSKQKVFQYITKYSILDAGKIAQDIINDKTKKSKKVVPKK